MSGRFEILHGDGWPLYLPQAEERARAEREATRARALEERAAARQKEAARLARAAEQEAAQVRGPRCFR